MTEPALLLMSEQDVRAAAATVDPVEVVRETLLLHAAGRTTLPAEAYLPWHTASGEAARSLALPGAVWGERPAIGLKLINSSLANPAQGLPRAQGWTFLFDRETARPDAMLAAGWISATRTAAYTVLSFRLLGDPATTRVAVLGCGALAEAHLRLLAAELPAASYLLHDLDPGRAQALAGGWADRLAVSVAGTAREAVAGAGLVVTVTTSTNGYLAWDWLTPGALIAHVSLDDVLGEVITRADLLLVDDWELVAADDRRVLGRMYRSGAVTGPAGQRFGSPARSGSPRQVDATLADLLTGRHPGRRRPEEVVLSNPFGMGVLDVALAAAIRDRAKAAGIGTVLTP